MDSDLSDIQKIEKALGASAAATPRPGTSRDHNDSPTVDHSFRCDSADGYSVASSYQQHLTPADQSFCILEELTIDSLEDNQLVIDNLEPSLENALNLNRAYQSMLVDLVQQLKVLQAVNQERQKAVQDEIDSLVSSSRTKQDRTKKKKITSFSFFGMPYFKSPDLETHPHNENTTEIFIKQFKLTRNLATVSPFRPMTKYELRRLRRVMRAQASNYHVQRLTMERTLEEAKLKGDEDPPDRQAIEERIQRLTREIFDMPTAPDEKVLDVPADIFKWDTISSEDFGYSRTNLELELYWSHFLKPGVNRKPWTAAENKKLKEIVKRYDNGIDWEELARDMQTGRTPFECFRRYQERFNPRHRKFGWAKEDNAKLTELMAAFNEKNMGVIDWGEVRRQLPGRSKTQIYAHLKYHASIYDPSRFSPAEDVVILEGMKMGYDSNDIALLLGKRSAYQVRVRYRAIQNKDKGPPWTERENNLLLSLKDVAQLSSKIRSKVFPGRSFAQLFSRFHYLRMKATSPQKYVEHLKAKRGRGRPKGTPQFPKKIGNLMSRFVEERKGPSSVGLKKGIPKFRRLLVGNLAKSVRTDRRGNWRRIGGHVKKSMVNKEKELKEIVRPLMTTKTKQPRKLAFPGDGREHGIILACLYRILQCNFTRAPPPEDLEDEDGVVEELGIAPQDALAFINLRTLTAGLVPHELDSPICLPPTLNTLTGFRGLLLHRKYLQSSASAEFTLSFPETEAKNGDGCPSVTLMEVTADGMDVPPMAAAGPSHETVPVPSTSRGNDPTDDVSTVISRGKGSEGAKEATEPDPLAMEDVQEGVPEASVPVPSTSRGNDPANVSTEISRGEGAEGAKEATVADPPAMEGVQEGVPESSNGSEEADCPFVIESSEDDDEEMEEMDEIQEEEEEEEDDDLSGFGDRRADALLLSRLLSLFYWPGIMSIMSVPDELKEDVAAKEAEAAAEAAQLPKPARVTPRMRKKDIKERRRAHMQAVVRKRHGKESASPEEQPPAVPSPSAATPTPPPPETENNNAAAGPPPAKRGRRPKDPNAATPPPVVTPVRTMRTRRSVNSQNNPADA